MIFGSLIRTSPGSICISFCIKIRFRKQLLTPRSGEISLSVTEVISSYSLGELSDFVAFVSLAGASVEAALVAAGAAAVESVLVLGAAGLAVSLLLFLSLYASAYQPPPFNTKAVLLTNFRSGPLLHFGQCSGDGSLIF
jgi:hypothetical protein